MLFDFSRDEAVRALTRALLHAHFHLDVQLPTVRERGRKKTWHVILCSRMAVKY